MGLCDAALPKLLWAGLVIDIVIMLAYVLYFASPGFSFFLSTSQEIVWKQLPPNDLFCVE